MASPTKRVTDETCGKLSRDEPKQRQTADKRSIYKSRVLHTMFFFLLVKTSVYLWDTKLVVQKPDYLTTTATQNRIETPSSSEQGTDTERAEMVASNKPDNITTSLTAQAPIEETPPSPSEQRTASPKAAGSDFEKGCSDLCTKREASRKEKFGGDLLNFQDILKLAEAGHENVTSKIRQDYGEYFDRIFVNQKDGGTHYAGMRPADLAKNPDEQDGPSRERMKRKMKIKVLKMMASVRETESNLHGCDCVGKNGSINSEVDESVSKDIPDFFEKYVFANGGHSNAAGHGNMLSEAYTAIFARDVRPIWEAIGIEMIDRNYAMGSMPSNPYVSTCIKEIFGTDVDFLAWNFGMTDKKPFSIALYFYRGALIPSRPAFVIVDFLGKLGEELAKVGFTMFRSKVNLQFVSQLPDMAPDGIPLSDQERERIPPMARNVKCNKQLEGGHDFCIENKWSCSEKLQAKGVDCICPHTGQRQYWHSGFKAHALQGHLLALPFIEMLLEALRELATSTIADSEELLADLLKEEDADFELFMESPLLDLLSDAYDKELGNKTDPLYETWFRGPSVCRTSLLPSQSRFLGIMTESGKTGDVAIYSHETYETAGFYSTGRHKNGTFQFVDDVNPPAGKLSLIATTRERIGYDDIKAYEAECPAIVKADYKDAFYGPFLDGKTSITFPSKKEKEYYGYDPKTFKGVIALVMPLFAWPGKCEGCKHRYDYRIEDFVNNNVTISVNSKPVKSIRAVRSDRGLLLLGDNKNPYWEPNVETEDYTIEFQVPPDAPQYDLLFTNFILM